MGKKPVISLKQYEEEMTRIYGEPGPERELKMFDDFMSKFGARIRSLIPDIEEISPDVMIGYVERIEGQSVLAVLRKRPGKADSKETLRSFSYDEATRYGSIEEQLPISLITYRTKGSKKYKTELIPFDINAPKTYVRLLGDVDFSIFDEKKPNDP